MMQPPSAVTIQAIWNFDTRASFANAVETKYDNSNEENVAPDSTQVLLK